MYDPELPVLRAEVWPGHNFPIFNGRMLLGPDRVTYVITFLLIGVPAIFYIAFTCVDIFRYMGWITGLFITVLGLTLFFIDLYFLVRVGTMDPGILQKNVDCYRPFFFQSRDPHTVEAANDDTETTHLELRKADAPSRNDGHREELPRTKQVEIDGVVMELKYCRTCKIYRTPRASHCSRCDCCIDRFDHHCPWTGTCIGRRNHRFFFAFVSMTCLLCLFAFVTSIIQVALLMSQSMKPEGPGNRSPYHDLDLSQAFLTSLSLSPFSFILILYSFVMIFSVGGLTLYHFYLIIINQTTYENANGRYKRRANPFNRGMLANIKDILWNKLEPSHIKLDQIFIFNEEIQEQRIKQRIEEDLHDQSIGIDIDAGDDTDELT